MNKLRQVLGKVAYVSKGTYDSSFLYTKNDVVTYEGSSYVALKETKGNVPTNEDFFMLLAKKGEDYVLTEEDKILIKNEITENANSVFNQNVNEKTNSFNENATNKTTIFNNNVKTKTDDFNSNVDEKTTSFNTNASNKLKEYNDNTTSKLEAYDTNANNKLETFNSNVTTKTTTFNENATSKTTDFNTNADNKTIEYNTNANNKVNEFNDSVDSIKKDINDNTSRSKRIEKVLYDSGEAEGTFINVKDSTLAEMQEIRIKNAEKQEITEKNKNYFTGRSLESSNLRGVTFSFDNSIVKLNGTSESAGVVYNVSSTKIKLSSGNWTLSFKVKSGTFTLSQNDLAIYIKNENNDNIVYFSLRDLEANVNSKQFTLEEETTILFYAYTNNSNVVLDNLEIVMQIEPGEIATEFEQFVPLAPAPDEIREIKAIDKNFNLISCNKNLFNLKKWSDVTSNRGTVEITDNSLKITSTNESNPDVFTESAMIISNNRVPENQRKYLFKVKPNTAYKILFDVDGTEKITTSDNSCYFCLVNKDYLSTAFKAFSGFVVPSTKNKTIIKTNEDTQYIALRFGCKIYNTSITYSNIMLVEENDDESYIEHQESVLPIKIPENEFIEGLDEYVVKYNKTANKPHLYLKKNVGRLILDGTETWAFAGEIENNISYQLKIDELTTYTKADIHYRASCTHFRYSNLSLYRINDVSKSGLFTFLQTGYNRYLRVVDKNATTVEEFKNWLSEHNVEVYYELAETYELDLGIVDMPLTFLNETNVFTDCDLQTEIKINYYRNPKLTIKELQKNLSLADSKILTLENDVNTLKEQMSQLITSSAKVNEEYVSEDIESELINNDISSE